MRHPIQLPNYMGCLMEIYTSLTLFYSRMSFKILKFSNRPDRTISLFPEQSTLDAEGFLPKKEKTRLKILQSLPGGIILVYCIGSNMG
jgi:hypothetical protein